MVVPLVNADHNIKLMKKLCSCVAAIMMFASCHKTDTSPTYNSIALALYEQAPKSKTVTIDAGTGGSFYGNSGTRYVFQPNSFKDHTGNLATGNIQIQVIEYLTKADMLFSRVLPVCNGEPLISGGETYAEATKNNEVLTLVGTYQVYMPTHAAADAGMRVFTAHPLQTTSLTLTGVLPRDWVAHDSLSLASIVYNGDTTQLTNDSMEFTNIDKFITNPNYQNFTVTIHADGGELNDAHVSVYAMFDNYNCTWYMASISNHVVYENHIPNIPVHFVAVALINGQFYSGIIGATPTTGSNYDITLKKSSPADLKAQINGL